MSAFVACTKEFFNEGGDGSLTIDATVENGNSSIVSVKALIANYGGGLSEVATGKYENGRLKIVLPPIIPTQYLYSMEVDAGITVSDKNALLKFIVIYAYDKDGKMIGEFHYMTAQVTDD